MTKWIDEGHQSHRVLRKFAWLPTQTLDAGWLWLRPYYVQEIIWGWGFHDRFPYAKEPSHD